MVEAGHQNEYQPYHPPLLYSNQAPLPVFLVPTDRPSGSNNYVFGVLSSPPTLHIWHWTLPCFTRTILCQSLHMIFDLCVGRSSVDQGHVLTMLVRRLGWFSGRPLEI